MIKIIAEIGVNHNGDLENAKKLALIAKQAGCDYVKLQKRTIDLCYSKAWLKRLCKSPWGDTVRDKVIGRELSWEQFEEFDKYCSSIGIQWAVSCFDIESFKEVNNRFIGLPFYKVPSGLVQSENYLFAVAKMKKLTLISTGLVDFNGVTSIMKLFENAECPYVLNHCVSLYPPIPSEFNMKYLLSLGQCITKRYCKGVGYSSHEAGIISSIIAVVQGAEWIEQHVTLNKSAYGADQKFSLEPEEIKQWVSSIRKAEAMMGGKSDKLFTGAEKKPVLLPEEVASVIIETAENA